MCLQFRNWMWGRGVLWRGGLTRRMSRVPHGYGEMHHRIHSCSSHGLKEIKWYIPLIHILSDGNLLVVQTHEQLVHNSSLLCSFNLEPNVFVGTRGDSYRQWPRKTSSLSFFPCEGFSPSADPLWNPLQTPTSWLKNGQVPPSASQNIWLFSGLPGIKFSKNALLWSNVYDRQWEHAIRRSEKWGVLHSWEPVVNVQYSTVRTPFSCKRNPSFSIVTVT